ncbi:hypothetical protein [Streptomyces roseochromogenus]|uniref:hypothetical protein n=1 Tax=Streptomyces roseochromogenus TaxID=285450 RepID=UPI00131A47B4|nr:hypothetical protein [Streptomyces roseochromogenus]
MTICRRCCFGSDGDGRTLRARTAIDWYAAARRLRSIDQQRWMRAYVTARYNSACAAWDFRQTHHWY